MTNLRSFIIEHPEARSRPTQNDKRLYQLPFTAYSPADRKLISNYENTLGVALDAMSTAVAKPAKAQDWGSRKAPTLDTDSFHAARVHGVACHDDG